MLSPGGQLGILLLALCLVLLQGTAQIMWSLLGHRWRLIMYRMGVAWAMALMLQMVYADTRSLEYSCPGL